LTQVIVYQHGARAGTNPRILLVRVMSGWGQDRRDDAPPRRQLYHIPWNKGKLTGAKPPLRLKHVWSIRSNLQIEGRTRDLAMFNLAIDSKLRGCDVVNCGSKILLRTVMLSTAQRSVSERPAYRSSSS
jgi:hypothetical protein